MLTVYKLFHYFTSDQVTLPYLISNLDFTRKSVT